MKPVIVPGQVWRENDYRFVRYVRVISVNGNKVRIRTCSRTGNVLYPGRPPTTANIERFRGQLNGYTKVR